MVNGLGLVAWGVGGIEAEAAMLGQPTYFLTPDVVGVHLTGALREGVTATDLVLRVTEILRKAKVVGKFVEFFGEGAETPAGPRARDDLQHGARVRRHHRLLPARRAVDPLPRADRPPEGASCDAFRAYYAAQGLLRHPAAGRGDYTEVLELDLATRRRRGRRAEAARRTGSSSAR